MTAPFTEMLGSTVKERMFIDRVRTEIWTDQHGRDYSTQVDKETGHPATPLTAVGWKPPFPTLYPPAKYLTVQPGRAGRLLVDYDRWLIDARDAEKEYSVWVLQVARQQFGAAALQRIQERDADLRRLAGPPPASVEFVKAMKAGNKWALGMLRMDGSRYPMPPWAEPIADTLIPVESWDGSSVDTVVDPSAYPDVEDDSVSARYAAYDQYGDVEDQYDADASPTFEPLPKRRGRPPKQKD